MTKKRNLYIKANMADAKIGCAFTLSKLYLNYCVGTPKIVRTGSGHMRFFAGYLNMLSS
jgi:hypothetical protein